jgi:polysaccharide export outer membrane protein
MVLESYEVPIQPGDLLTITVSALNAASAAPYNFPAGTKGATVDQEGNIAFPQLGTLKVSGLTRTQFRNLLISRLKTYLTDPVVTVDFVNFKITVLGEVVRPGTITVSDGKINLLEALAQAGDITEYGKKNQVEIIREVNGKREFGWVNLLSTSAFTTPYYRLRQNDIVYVHSIEDKPNASQVRNDRRIGLLATIVSVATTFSFLIYTISR